MLLKVSDGAGGWVYFDDVSRVHIQATRSKVRSKEELDAFVKDGEYINLVTKSCLRLGTPIDVGVIEFFQGEIVKSVLFTSVAFICNDAGDTIERVNATPFGQQAVRKR